jgi:hypothetical protein
MSQQYGPPPGPPPAPAPAPSGWGTAPGGGWGSGPVRPPQRPASNRTPWIIMAGVIVAVALVAVGVVVLVTGGGTKDEPAAQQTPDPTGTLYTPSPTPTPNDSKGPNDTGVEVGWGVWFTPARGWLQAPDKTVSGKYYILQQFNVRGLIDGFYWVRQTELYGVKDFAEHLADVESNGMQGVKISKAVACQPNNPNIKACYSLTYSGVWVSPTSKKTVAMQGFITAYQDQFNRVTATDAALETRVYKRRVNELAAMNNSVVKSF